MTLNQSVLFGSLLRFLEMGITQNENALKGGVFSEKNN